VITPRNWTTCTIRARANRVPSSFIAAGITLHARARSGVHQTDEDQQWKERLTICILGYVSTHVCTVPFTGSHRYRLDPGSYTICIRDIAQALGQDVYVVRFFPAGFYRVGIYTLQPGLLRRTRYLLSSRELQVSTYTYVRMDVVSQICKMPIKSLSKLKPVNPGQNLHVLRTYEVSVVLRTSNVIRKARPVNSLICNPTHPRTRGLDHHPAQHSEILRRLPTYGAFPTSYFVGIIASATNAVVMDDLPPCPSSGWWVDSTQDNVSICTY
jgi:hypothetical protein